MGGKANQISWLLCALFLACPAQAKYGGGTGEPNNPYLIYTPEQMNTIGAEPNDWNKHFKLMADIDLSEYKDTGFNIIGYRRDWYDNKPFTGSFEGDGHTISNLYCESENASYIGLFGLVDSGVISNLWLIDPNVDGRTAQYVGALVGYSWSGIISGCSVEGGSVTGGEKAGGLVGYNAGTIIECYSSSSVSGNCAGGLVGGNIGGIIHSSYATGDVSGDTPVGGLVGQNGAWLHGLGEMISVSGAIDNCYSMCGVAGTAVVGGLVGLNDVGNIATCYSSGTVLGNEQIGGLVGKNNSRVSYCFWDIETSGTPISGGGTGKTTAEMQTANTFLSWGACRPLWTIDEGRDYPRLAWENIPGQVITGPTYGGGSGTADDPYLIYTAEELNTIGLSFCDWNSHFKLMGDIDLLNFDGKDGRPAFNIIGSDRTYPFTGVFDGNSHRVSHLTLIGKGNLGMFGYLVSGAGVRDLGIVDVNISGSGNSVGALAGCSYGEVTRCYSSGTVVGDWSVGGLVGASLRYIVTATEGTVTQCHSTSVVIGNGWIGGLVGSNSAVITQSYSTGAVSGEDRVGGLVGNNDGDITESYSTCAVNGSYLVGGLIGYNSDGPVTRCYSTGVVSGTSTIGGLLGYNNVAVITACYSTGATSGNNKVGGLIGHSQVGTINGCYSSGPILGTSNLGGLVGSAWSGKEFYSYWNTETSGLTVSQGGEGKTTFQMKQVETFLNWVAEPAVWTIDHGNDYPCLAWQRKAGQPIDSTLLSQFLNGRGTQSEPYFISEERELRLIGGLFQEGIYFRLISDIDLSSKIYSQAVIALFSGVFDGCGFVINRLTIDTMGADKNYLGLFGKIGETGLVRSLGIGDANITGGTRSDCLGTLAGRNDGIITACFSNATVSQGEDVGGLVGENWGTVIQCHSIGSISGSNRVGGLAGHNRNTIIDCYSTASVTGSGYGAGGLAGENWQTMIHCYSTGRVFGNKFFGGLTGYQKDWGSLRVRGSFWDITTSGQTASAGGVGKTTAEMQVASTFLEAGWDFVGETANGIEDTWWILEGKDYPRLWWELAGQGE